MLRTFTPNDLEQVMRLWLDGNLEAHPFIAGEYWEDNAGMVAKQLQQAEVYVWEEEGEIRGFAGLQENYLAGIFVKNSCRSKGVGRKLLDHVKATRSFFFLHVYAENERAVAFYRREGLEVVSGQTEEDTGRAEYTMRWNGSAG